MWEGGRVWLRASGAGGDPSDGRPARDGDSMAAGGDPRENEAGWRRYGCRQDGGGRVAAVVVAEGTRRGNAAWLRLRELRMELAS
ncbi:hypothetical protein GUJ93_ZPchr0009g914 [Zizania palustris]|uniref:Uncharacterized protein n=1 Tax=Zizania palustris TaxID=103762 RepID=A0A8J5RXQ4_ZIZPA|nr:hypothetical protein GUJ93_ZPchr0009g914 [Zizania palustris]